MKCRILRLSRSIAPPKPKCPCCGKAMLAHREIPRPPFVLREFMEAAARQATATPFQCGGRRKTGLPSALRMGDA
ncbi:MAG: hypothetical protein ACOYMN_15685 [Roseimicrobium sp.]